jgi:hypothetical protein
MVRGGTDTLATMVKTSSVDGDSQDGPDYRDRLAEAMKDAGIDPDDPDEKKRQAAMKKLAGALGSSYTAVWKLVTRNGTTQFGGDNNSKAAAFLGVNPDWLATGVGNKRANPWPFPLIDRNRYDQLDDSMKGYVQRALEDALEKCESKAGKQPSHKKSIADQIEDIQPTLPPGILAIPDRRLAGRQVTGGTGAVNPERRKTDHGQQKKGTG